MNCSTFRELAHEFAEGVLPPEQAEPARDHVADCAACAERVAAARRFDQFLSSEGDVAIEAWSSHQASLRALADEAAPRGPAQPAATPPMRALSRRRPASIWRMAPFAGVAAASALFVAIAYSFLSGPELLAEGSTAELDRGEHVLASEGRELEAVDEARVTVPEGSGGRIVRLEAGTVLFSVQSGRSFSVETPQGTASVVGTSFHVAVSPSRQVSVSVLAGKVRFEAADREAMLLGAGDRLEVDASGVQKLISRRRLDDLQADLAKTREDAAVLRRERDSHPKAADESPAPAATGESVAEAVRAFLVSDEGRQALAEAAKAATEESASRVVGGMIDGMIDRFSKSADLTEDQTRRMREIFHRTGTEFRDAWKPLHSIPADTSEADRERIRREVSEKSAEIERRKTEEMRLLLSQTQFEKYQKAFPAMTSGR